MTTHIKMPNVPPRVRYVADGTQNEFETNFTVFKKTDIKVYINEKEQKTGFDLSEITAYDTISVVFKKAPEKDSIVTLLRDLPIERTSDFQEGGALRADVLNYEFDYQTACLQQVADKLNRSMVLPPYAADPAVDFTLPEPKAGKAIVWNAGGTHLENSEVEVNGLVRFFNEKIEIASEKAGIAETAAETASVKAAEAVEQVDGMTEKLTDVSNKMVLAEEEITAVKERLAEKAEKDALDELTEDQARKLIGNRIWVSGEYQPVLNTNTIATHNLNLTEEQIKRSRVECLLKCVTAEKGYAVGKFAGVWGIDEASFGTVPVKPVVDSSTITVRTTTGIRGLNKDTTTWSGWTAANWRYVFVIEY